MPVIDEIRVETPEQIEVDFELAGLGSRFLAQTFDWFIKSVGSIFLFLVFGCIGAAMGIVAKEASTLIIAILGAVFYSCWMGFGIYYEVRWNGQTPGKWLAGIRAVRTTGSPITFASAGIRNFLAFVDVMPPFFFLGAFLILLTPRRQRLGDMAAGTIVIRDRDHDLGKEPEAALADYASKKVRFSNLQLANLKTHDRRVLREFLRRCNYLEGRSGPRLARRLGMKYAAATGYPLERPFRNGAAARTFLASLLRDLQEYLRHA